ncbi:MAG: Acyl-CoA dehydrogenase, partial [uncultured Friedmanniella sp.]
EAHHLRRGPRGVPGHVPHLRGPGAAARPGEAHRRPRVRPRRLAGAGPPRPAGAQRPRGVRRRRRRRPPLHRGAQRGALQAVLRLPVVRRHPRRLRGALPGRPRHRGAEAPLAAPVLHRRAGDRHRHDRALGWVRPRRAEDHGGPRRRGLGAQRLQDLHHQRLVRRPGPGRRPHQPGEGCPRHHPVRRRDGDARVRARPQARQGGPARVRHRRAVLRRRPAGPRAGGRRGRRRLRRDDGAARHRADRRGRLQPLARPADPRRDLGLRAGATGVRPADRLLPGQPVHPRRAGHHRRGHPGLRRRLRAGAAARPAHRRRRGQGQVVDRAGAERHPRRLRPALGRLRLHERVPGDPGLGRRPGVADLGRVERDHEGADRARPRARRPAGEGEGPL